jgi:hypothetical protein
MRQSNKQCTTIAKGIEPRVDQTQSSGYESQVRILLGMPDRGVGEQIPSSGRLASQLINMNQVSTYLSYRFQPYGDDAFEVNQEGEFLEAEGDHLSVLWNDKKQEIPPSLTKNLPEGEQSSVQTQSVERSRSDIEWTEVEIAGSGKEKISHHRSIKESADLTPVKQKTSVGISVEDTQVDNVQIPGKSKNPQSPPALLKELLGNKQPESLVAKNLGRSSDQSSENLIQTTPAILTPKVSSEKVVKEKSDEKVSGDRIQTLQTKATLQLVSSEDISVAQMPDHHNLHLSPPIPSVQPSSGHQQTIAQIEQLREAVRQLSEKVSEQAKESTERDKAVQPGSPIPPPQPVVVVNRYSVPARTPRAFWERRYLGRARLKVTR